MTTTEFSQAFDAQIAAYNDSPEFGTSDNKLAFDEYEKSVFLTRAQDELVASYYSGKNPYGDSFESSEEIRRYLANLIETKQLYEEEESSIQKISNDSHLFKLEDNTMFITYEAVVLDDKLTGCLAGATLEVIPVTQDEYHRISKNPFRQANIRRALRLDVSDNVIELICKYPISHYLVRYLREPNPIIVADLSDDIDIKGKHESSECELHPSLHRTILDRAIQMAILSKNIQQQRK